jgi:hypothetical protein
LYGPDQLGQGVSGEKQPFFNHTIVVGGKVLSSRTNYEPAGDDLARVTVEKMPPL